MCDVLHLRYDIVAKIYNKTVSVERFHRFLNKSQKSGITEGYAWNSAPNDGTDIMCSVPAIGLELWFYLDIELQGPATLTANNTNSTLEYLRLTHVDRSFAISILQQIIKDIRVSHAECINNKRIFFNYKADGLEMTLTEV